jgi:O-antigen ligase
MPHLGIDGIVGQALWVMEFVAFFLSVFWRPSIGLYLLIPLLPLETVRYRLHPYFLGAQFVDVLLLGVMLGLKRQNKPIFPKTPLTTLLFVYIAFTYLSMVRGSFFLGVDLPLWFSDPRVSGWKNFVVDLSLVYFLTASAIRDKRQMGILIFAMCIGSLLVTKGFHNTIADRDFSSFSYDLRTAGPLGGAGVNGLAAFEAQFCVFLTALCLSEKGVFKKLGYAGAIWGAMYCLTFALSRGGYGALLIGLAFLGIMRHRLLFVAIIVFLAAWQSVVPTAVRERVLMTEQDGTIDPSAGARLTLWQEAMQVFQADPVFGTGFNTYAYGSHFEGYHDTHNVYVKVLVETGATGLFVFVCLLRKLFQSGFHLYRTASDRFLMSLGLAFATLMVSAMVANMFGDRWMYFQITGYTYAVAGMVASGQRLTDESEEEAGPADIDDPALVMAAG